MDKHNFQWENSLFLWPFSIAMLNYQRVISGWERLGRSSNRLWPWQLSWASPTTIFPPSKTGPKNIHKTSVKIQWHCSYNSYMWMPIQHPTIPVQLCSCVFMCPIVSSGLPGSIANVHGLRQSNGLDLARNPPLNSKNALFARASALKRSLPSGLKGEGGWATLSPSYTGLLH